MQRIKPVELKTDPILESCCDAQLKKNNPLVHGDLLHRLRTADTSGSLQLGKPEDGLPENVAYGELIGVRFTDAINFLVYWIISTHGEHNLKELLNHYYTHVGIRCECLNPGLYQYTAVVVLYGKLKTYYSKNIDPVNLKFGNQDMEGLLKLDINGLKSDQPVNPDQLALNDFQIIKNDTVQVNLTVTTVVQPSNGSVSVTTNVAKREVSEVLTVFKKDLTPEKRPLFIQTGGENLSTNSGGSQL